ncbi:MAG: hypothetical protein GY842_12800, partial [bacterium]|nr:hypothetical protein [bacterium]
MVVSDTLRVEGVISAGGADATSYSGGGAGGSIWIETGVITGTGVVRADGGVAASGFNNQGGGGAGGRIAIYFDDDRFTSSGGEFLARGGAGWQYGGAGTVYLFDRQKSVAGSLLVDNGGQDGSTAEIITGTWAMDQITMTGYGHLTVIGDSSVLTVTGSLLGGDGSSNLRVEGLLVVPTGTFAIDGVTVVLDEGRWTPPENLDLTWGGLDLYAANPWYGRAYTFTNVAIHDTGRLELVSRVTYDDVYTDDYGIELWVENLTIDDGGMISADGQGYAGGTGPGAGVDGDNGGGGGHGGRGGDSRRGMAGGAAYDSVYHPVQPGSSGGVYGSSTPGAGGGALRMVVSDTLRVEGVISAGGADAT